MVISAVLLPNNDDEALLVRGSLAINRQADSLIQLGESMLPHITIVQLVVEGDRICNELWRDIAPHAAEVTQLPSTQLACIVSQRHDQTWVELQFEKTSLLESMRKAVLDAPTAQRHTVHNPDIFRPHCTLGLLEGQSKPGPKFDMGELDLFDRVFTDLKLAVGVNGENFTFSEARFSA